MVIDSSALLAIIFNEPLGPWVIDQLRGLEGQLRMSTVNYAEVLILIEERQPRRAAEIRAAIHATGMRLAPPTVEQAEVAAAARLRYRLNLGDCFAYALAKTEESPLLTLDRDFRKTDIEVILPPQA